MAKEHAVEKAPYQNNPLLLAIDSISLIFKKAKSIAILAIVLCVVLFFAQIIDTAVDISNQIANPVSEEESSRSYREVIEQLQAFVMSIDTAGWVTILAAVLLITAGILVLDTIVGGIINYTAAQLAKGKEVTLKQAFQGVMKRFFPYLGLYMLVTIKILLWSLLFIIPGIVMAVRYSLSGVSFFNSKKGINASIEESLALTKNTWLTTFGSLTFLNMITLGAIQLLLLPGTLALLYRQYTQHETRPPAHVLSWLALFLPIVLVILFLLLVALIAILILYAGSGYLQS